MITAEQAGEQGRTVFAVPGRIDTPMSRGPHELLRSGARLVEDVKDILDEFATLFPAAGRAAAAEGPDAAATPFRFSPEEQAVVAALVDGALDADTLARRAGLPAAKLSAMLIGLEMKRVVRMLPGRQVQLAVRLPDDARATLERGEA